MRVSQGTKRSRPAPLARAAVGLVGVGLLLAGTRASAQELYRSPYAPPPAPAVLAPAVPALPANPVPVPPGAAPLPSKYQPTALQKEKDKAKDAGTPATPAMVSPGQENLFRVESERALLDRFKREEAGRAREQGRAERAWRVPEEAPLTTEAYVGRYWPPLHEMAEPGFVCYNRLLFEQINLERYGWDLGPVTPLLSALKFYWDVALLPYNVFTRPCDQCECSAGYCLPGDPVPLKLYFPEASGTGALAEAGTIVALLVLFP
jgi:hypothetical protein